MPRGRGPASTRSSCCGRVGTVVAWRFNERAFAQTALILEAAGEGIFGLDTQGQVTFMNPAAARMLGVSARAAVGKPIDRFVHHLSTEGTPMPHDESSIFAPLRDRTPGRPPTRSSPVRTAATSLSTTSARR